MKKVLFALVLIVVLLVGGGVGFLTVMNPAQRPPSTEKVEATPERVERGRYLVETVIGCWGCHSEFDLETFNFPPAEGKKGVGGFCFDKENAGFPGKVCAQNITQAKNTGIGAWTDGEIMRAFREGVSRDGHALFPMMPYPYLKNLSDEDARSIVAYLRTIPGVEKDTPVGFIDFPVNLIIKMKPQPLDGPVPEPDKTDSVAYGKYLAWVSCVECHTPVDDQMEPLMDKIFSGGRLFDFSKVVPGLRERSANLTPDADTGIGKMTKENFIGIFASFRDPSFETLKVKSDQNTLMPWVQYSHLTDEDLGAIYDYLRTVPAIKNQVDRRPRPKLPEDPQPSQLDTDDEPADPDAPPADEPKGAE